MKKIALSKETVRSLESSAMSAVVGGASAGLPCDLTGLLKCCTVIKCPNGGA